MGSVAMAFTGLLASGNSYLYTAKDPAHDGVHARAILGVRPQGMVGQAHRGDVLGARQLAGGVGQVVHVRRHQVPDVRFAREREAGGPLVLDHLQCELGQQAAAAAEIEVGGEPLAALELLEADRESLQQDLRIGAEELGDLAVLLGREESLRVAQLAGLGLLVAEAERERQAARERAAAEVEHPRALDPAVADERHVRGPAADVDEDPALGPRLLACAGARERIRLGNCGRKLEVELANHGVDGVDVGHGRERVEDGDLEVPACESHRVGDRIAVDPDVRDRGMDQAGFELAVAPFELEQMLRLAQRSPLDHLQHGRDLARPHAPLRVLAWIGDRRREALDELAGDADDDLAGHGLGHVLRGFQRSVAGLYDRLQVGDRTARHGGGRLRLPADAEHLSVQPVTPHDQHLDEVGADVEDGEVAVVVAALAQELEFRHVSSASRRLNASAGVPVRVPRARCGRPPPLPRRPARRAASYSGVRSLDTLITNWPPATTVTTPDFTISRYRSAYAASSSGLEASTVSVTNGTLPLLTASPLPPLTLAERSCSDSALSLRSASFSWARRLWTRPGSWSAGALNDRASDEIKLRWRWTRSSAASPATMSMRRSPEPMLDSETITTGPISAVFTTCVPPHSSQVQSPKHTTRTTSPYFSSNRCMAPCATASLYALRLSWNGRASRTFSITRRLMCSSSCSLMARLKGTSNVVCSGPTQEPF